MKKFIILQKRVTWFIGSVKSVPPTVVTAGNDAGKLGAYASVWVNSTHPTPSSLKAQRISIETPTCLGIFHWKCRDDGELPLKNIPFKSHKNGTTLDCCVSHPAATMIDMPRTPAFCSSTLKRVAYLRTERSINRRHVHTKQIGLSIAGMYIRSRQELVRVIQASLIPAVGDGVYLRRVWRRVE